MSSSEMLYTFVILHKKFSAYDVAKDPSGYTIKQRPVRISQYTKINIYICASAAVLVLIRPKMNCLSCAAYTA
jgi:hypothetical protein